MVAIVVQLLPVLQVGCRFDSPWEPCIISIFSFGNKTRLSRDIYHIHYLENQVVNSEQDVLTFTLVSSAYPAICGIQRENKKKGLPIYMIRLS